MRRQYPIGLQDFKEIRTAGKLYVDKTTYVYHLAHGDSKYIFLSRPRRFGKTLLTSTLQYYFEGQKELFDGLYIGEHETEWASYPVLRFDMSMGKGFTVETLNNYLNDQLDSNERRMGVQVPNNDVNIRMKNLIEETYRKTGKQVVVLIDEYDAPILDTITKDDIKHDIRLLMSSFYSPLKGCDKYLRFVFLTGITKFSQLGIFSGLNNINNISMDKEYAAICGISKKELVDQMQPDIAMLGEDMGLTAEKTLEKLVENYDGYHFTWPSDDIFNPYSLLLAFSKKSIGSYWFETATSRSLIELLQTYDVLPTKIERTDKEIDEFNTPIEDATDCYPLLYQYGYLTIKGFDDGFYALDIPNEEVKAGLMKCLMKNFLPGGYDTGLRKKTARMRKALEADNMEASMQTMSKRSVKPILRV